MNEELDRLILEWLHDEGGHKDKAGKYRVSDAGKCYLMRYMKRHGVERVSLPPEKIRRRFWVGHVFHEFVQQKLSAIFSDSDDVEIEKRVEDEHRVGHVDIVWNGAVYELKTIKSLKYISNAIKHHELQVVTYTEMLGLEDCFIVYIDIQSFDIQQIEPTPSAKRRAWEDWNTAISFWEQQQLPPTTKDWYCDSCPFKDICPEHGGSWSEVEMAIEKAKERNEEEAEI